jgi:uncharacterized protein
LITRVETRVVAIPVSEKDHTSGILSFPPEGSKRTAIILAHGAANDMMNPLLVAFAEGLAEEGYPVLRFNFLYAEHQRKSPDKEPVLTAAWEAAHRFLKDDSGIAFDHVVAAGKSLGGRIASQMVTREQLPVEGLVFLGYPLHRMGDSSILHHDHLYSITIPMLFVEGTRDALCDMDALATVFSRLRGPHDLYAIEGGDHSFHVSKSAGLSDTEIYGRIVTKTAAWLSSQAL